MALARERRPARTAAAAAGGAAEQVDPVIPAIIALPPAPQAEAEGTAARAMAAAAAAPAAAAAAVAAAAAPAAAAAAAAEPHAARGAARLGDQARGVATPAGRGGARLPAGGARRGAARAQAAAASSDGESDDSAADGVAPGPRLRGAPTPPPPPARAAAQPGVARGAALAQAPAAIGEAELEGHMDDGFQEAYCAPGIPALYFEGRGAPLTLVDTREFQSFLDGVGCTVPFPEFQTNGMPTHDTERAHLELQRRHQNDPHHREWVAYVLSFWGASFSCGAVSFAEEALGVAPGAQILLDADSSPEMRALAALAVTLRLQYSLAHLGIDNQRRFSCGAVLDAKKLPSAVAEAEAKRVLALRRMGWGDRYALDAAEVAELEDAVAAEARIGRQLERLAAAQLAQERARGALPAPRAGGGGGGGFRSQGGGGDGSPPPPARVRFAPPPAPRQFGGGGGGAGGGGGEGGGGARGASRPFARRGGPPAPANRS